MEINKICKNCLFWKKGHNCFLESESFGSCDVLDGSKQVDGTTRVVGVVEGCLDVKEKCFSFEFVTGENFGCLHFSQTK